MAALVYSVLATLPDAQTTSKYLAWLTTGHTAQVIQGGAVRAEVSGPIPAPATNPGGQIVESRYLFPTQEAFATYERDHAPALRAEGMALFGSHTGVRFERRLAPLIQTLESPQG